MTAVRIERKPSEYKPGKTLCELPYLGKSGILIHVLQGETETGRFRLNEDGLVWYPNGRTYRRVFWWDGQNLKHADV